MEKVISPIVHDALPLVDDEENEEVSTSLLDTERTVFVLSRTLLEELELDEPEEEVSLLAVSSTDVFTSLSDLISSETSTASYSISSFTVTVIAFSTIS